MTHALATRILFEGRRARGVEYSREGVTHRARVDAELILSGGPINSPQLLKLSGIGPAAELRAHGIDVIARSAGRRRELAGSSGVLFPSRLQGAHHPVFVDQLVESCADRCALAAAQGWLGRHQSFRDLRLHPQPRRHRLSGHSISLPADGRGVRRIDPGARARLSSARRTDALQEPRLGALGLDAIHSTSRAFYSTT